MEIFLFLISIYFLVTNPTLSGCKFFKKNQYFRSILESLIDKTFPYLKKLLLKFAILSLLIEQVFLIFVTTSNALANAGDLPITPDGSTSTQIDQSANGVKIVNIAPANSNSVSHNKFTDYNVNHNGLILNNATGSQNGLILTQIGGLINDNLNLKNSGFASIILNEVTSSNTSQINGFTEIAGSKADLILANPNGFVFNGAGFINVNKLTAVVGSNHTQNSNALNFQLSDQQFVVKNGFLPKITITGKGLDLEKVSSSDLVANVMNIIAPIYAGNNDVNLRSGDDNFDYLSKTITSLKSDNPSSTCVNQATQCPDSEVNKSDSIAIDASALGKIQAGKIFIIATKEGFGIKYNGDLLAQRSGIVIDSHGNIDYQNVSATGNANQANISITSHRGSITQNGIIQTKDLANNITLNAFKEIKNYGKFFSSADIDIESKTQDFINYSQTNLAKNNFTIKAINFSNLGEITAENNLKINTHQVSNSNKLVANANLIINADQINNRNSLYSQNNIALNANEINNNTQDSQIYALNDIALKTNSINNLDGKIQAKNNIKLQDLALNDLSPDWQFKINDQLISINNANGNFYAKNLLEFDLQNADYSIAGDLKSDGKIKITANNITNQINLQANNDLEIIALDTFTSGVLNGDNSNTKIIANNKLSITATNLLRNYATLSAKNNLELTSLENNINNHINAEIIAGTKTKIDSQDGKEKYLYQGLLTLNAKNGIVNQNSLNSIIVNGNYNLDVTDFINTGKVEVAGDLFFNIANDLINDVKALILAGGNLEINVGNDLTNKTDAVIYSQGNLTIQKYPSSNPLYNPEDNKINKLTNSSGQIISYNGDMTINAKTIENKRTIDPFNAVLDPQNKGTISNSESEKLNQYSWIFNNQGCFGHKCENIYLGYYALQLTNTGSIPSLIQSNKNLFFYADNLNNIASNILAQGDITVNANEFKNFSVNDAGLYYLTNSWGNNSVYSLASVNYIRHDPGNGSHTGSYQNPANYLQINTANFKSAKKIFLNTTKEIGNEKTQEDSQVSKTNQREANLINSLSVSEIINNGIINLNLSNYFSAQSVIGLFVKNSNPNSPLFETRSQFIDQSKFFGSDYFYQKIGLNLTDLQTQLEQQNQRLVGDQFFQNKIISDQLATITKNSFLLSAKETNANNEIKSLLDNASDEYKRLNLTANKALSSDQINSLQKDIVWYEAQNINGSSYIVPKIYLSKTSRDNLKNQALATKSTIYAGGDLEINSSSGSLNNSGSIIANNIKITTKDDIINNNFSEIIASNDLALNSLSGSITNRSKLEANNDLTLVAKKNITNTSTVITNDSNLLNSGNVGYVANGLSQDNQRHIASNILETATILAGNITINAGEDFNNNSANIATAKNTLVDNSTTSGNITITAGDDINISTLELKNRTETSWGSKSKGGKSVVETTTNISSNIDSAGSLTLLASKTSPDSQDNDRLQGSNIQITGSNLNASNDIKLISQDDVNIESAQNNSYQETQSWKRGSTVAKSSISGNQSTTNVLSNLTSVNGNISITSGSDTNLIGVKLKAEDIEIKASDEVNIYSVLDQNNSWSSSTKTKNISSKISTAIGIAMLTNPNPWHFSSAIVINKIINNNDKSQSSSNLVEKNTNLASVIDASGDITITSNQDLTISGSDISGKTGSLISNQGNIDILTAQEIVKNSSTNNQTARANDVIGYKGVKHSASETNETITNVASNLTFNNSLLIQTIGNSNDTPSIFDINIKGSNLKVSDGDLTINSKGNVTIENAVDSTSTESSNKKRNEITKSFSTSTDYVETASSSNLSANNLNISSLGDTTIQGSNIYSKENLIIGSFVIAQNYDGTYQKDANGNYLTTSANTVDNLTIKDAELKEYHLTQKNKSYQSVAGVGMRAVPFAVAPLQIFSSVIKETARIFLNDSLNNIVMNYSPVGYAVKEVDKAGDELGANQISKSTETRTDKTTSYASNIKVGGSMMTNSVGDTLIQGSNLNIAGDLLANSLGDFKVVAATNTESSTSQNSYETAGKFHSELNLAKLNYRAGLTKDFVEEGANSSYSTVAQSNLNVGGSALINSSGEFALRASNFLTKGSVEIIAKDNLNILADQNKQSSTSYLDQITLDTGIQIGNAYADAAYKVVDAVKAQKTVKESYDKLEKIKDLKEQGMASSKAVERAEYQVVLALVNAGLSVASAMQAVANAGQAASTSFGTGFYGSFYANLNKLKSSSTSEYSQSIASNLSAGDSISLTSGNGDINITGSNVSSTNGNLNLTAMLGNLNVNAGESTASQSYKMKSQSLGGSIGNNGFSANIGMSEAQTSQDQTTYANSQLLAQNGSLNINTAKDTNLFGANLLASNVNIDVGGNLMLKSRQNLSESDSYNIGMSLGVSGDSSGVSGGSVGFSLGNGYSNRAFVDQVSSIIGTNSVNINVANNTNIVGAVIANQDKDGKDLGNLNLKTSSLTYSDLNNFSVSESNQLSTNLQAGYNPNNPTQNGNLAIKLNMQGSESSSTTKATIGKGNITINEILNDESKIANLNREINNIEQNKKTVITSDFDSEIKIDLRLIASVGNLMIGDTDKASANWNSYATQTKKGFNISYDALAIPLNSLSKTVSGDLNASDALLATGKNYQNLYQLAYNQNIVLEDLAGEGKLITYNGNQLDANSESKYANGFYDRNSDTAAINADSNKSDSQLAGTAAHEGAHRMFNSNGQSYTQSEESASHMIGDFAESRWDTYQSGNTSLRASLPTSSINFNNNFYANNVKFGNDVNPLIVDRLANTIKPGLGDSMNSGLKNFKESSLNTAADKYVNSNDPIEKVGLALMLGIGSVALPESVTDLELSAALGGVSKAYAPEIAAGANKVDDAASGLWNKLFGSSTPTKTNPVDFYVAPNGDTMPSTAYRYMDSRSSKANTALETNSGVLDSYFGFEKINSPAKVQDRYQILPQWSNAKVRGEFDTLQLFDANGNLNAKVPLSNGNKGLVPEPFANSYPKETHGNGGGAQMIPKIDQQINYKNVTKND